MNKKLSISALSEIEILCLLSAASVLRKYKYLKNILKQCAEIKISSVKIYEALLQTYLFAGFPSALISLQIFREYFPQANGKKMTGKNYYDEGVITCKKIYGNKFEKLRSNINSFSPEMALWFIEEGYGKVLSRKGLNLKERELCIVSILSALKYENQVYSHINGAYRQKATVAQIGKIISNLNFIGSGESAVFGLKILDLFKDKKLILNKVL